MTDTAALPVASLRDTWRTVERLLRPHRWRAALTLATLLAATIAALAVPPLLGHVVDLVVDERPADALAGPAIAVLALTVAQGVLTGWGTALVARVGEPVLAELRERVVRHALSIPLGQIERAGSGDLLARVSDDVAETANAVRNALPALTLSGLTVGLTIGGLAVLDWRLALAGLCAAPIQAWTLRWYLSRAPALYAAERAAGSDRAQRLLDSIGGAATVRAFGLTDDHSARVAQSSRAALDLSLQTAHMQTRFYGRLNAAELVGTGTILVTGFFLVDARHVSVGEATAAALYFVRLFDPLNALFGLIDDAQSAAASLARLVAVTRIPAPVPCPAPAPPAGTAVRATAVGFAYTPGRDVLRGIDIALAPGERVALVGVSGAGKTTLAKLVAGIHHPTAGSLARSGRVGLVTQEVHVFAGTIADDLRLTRPDADECALVDALDQVGASAWVHALPDGLQTVVGDGGHRMSAAEAQQLALARLALSDPPIAVLDEATAEAGSARAAALEAAADRALQGRTALIVAHRLTQAARADRIVVLEEGRVLETGTHESLVEAGGAYASLWSAWAGPRQLLPQNGQCRPGSPPAAPWSS